MVRKNWTDQEIRREGFAALIRQLGPAGAIRFLQQYEPGRGNYTRDRKQWIDSVTIDDVARESRKPS